MNVRKRLVVGAMALAVVAATGTAGEPPEYEMRGYVMGLVFRGPAWTGSPDAAAGKARARFLRNLVSDTLLAAAGTIEGHDALTGIMIFRADSAAQVRDIVDRDPAVQAGTVSIALHPWYAAAGLGDTYAAAIRANPDTQVALVAYQLGLLKRGGGWTPEVTEDVQRIQRAHLENINRLAADGSLVLAGPFTDGGSLRGVFVFKTAGLEEAKNLSDTDPAVVAGRLVVELSTLLLPEGVIPDSPGRR